MNYGEVKTTGEPRDFGTGAFRDANDNKGRYDLLPFHAIHRLAQHYQNGAKKYGDDNWRNGIPENELANSALRHICEYAQGQRDEDHLAAAIWNLCAMIETEYAVENGKLPDALCNLKNWYAESEGGWASVQKPSSEKPSEVVGDTEITFTTVEVDSDGWLAVKGSKSYNIKYEWIGK